MSEHQSKILVIMGDLLSVENALLEIPTSPARRDALDQVIEARAALTNEASAEKKNGPPV